MNVTGLVKRGKHAFTLIELLVVIAIIALLVSILMPSLQKAKELAKDVVCKSSEKGVSYGIILYAQEYDDQIPCNVRGFSSWEPPDPPLSWEIRIGIIPDDKDALPFNMWEERDPDLYEIARNGYSDHNRASLTEGMFKCPTAVDNVKPKYRWPTDERWGCHLSINEGMSPMYNASDVEDIKNVVKCVSITDVRGGAVMIGDAHVQYIGNNGWMPNTLYKIDNKGNLQESVIDVGMQPGKAGPWMLQQNRLDGTGDGGLYGHPGDSANLAYADGHVAGMKIANPEDWNIK